MSNYPDCYESSNVICKHIRASVTVYVDLNDRLADGFTLQSATAESDDATLEIGEPDVLDADLVISSASACGGLTLKSGRALRFTVAGGTVQEEDANGNESETIIVVGFLGSDGQQDYVDCRLLLGGTP